MRTFVTAAFLAVSSAALAGETMSSTINPYAHLNDNRAELAAAYPELSEAELDKLIFRIADVRSLEGLNAKEQVAVTE